MIKLNKQEYLDKLHACWIGKSIGGTIGGPFEGTHEYMDIKGFTTPSGEPLPNDDLDLQMVWLSAMEEVGAKHFNTNILAEYWLDWIPPHWNEYGICKTNLIMGLLPPASGELDNERWKKSNGAWIRSEIWAGLSPAVVDTAIKYAAMDAMVDHGIDEGTCAEIFTAAIQSAAYAERDIHKLLKIGLSKIPENCAVAKTVRLVMDMHSKGIDIRETREKVVELNAELGWFQAPNNLGFVAIGLLYGEGDFKKSVLYAVNCGDDTDCTAGTVAATLGIIGGTAGIPDDWKEFVGERILTVSINGTYARHIPKNCTELTYRVAALVPDIMKANDIEFEFTNDKSDIPESEFENYNKNSSTQLLDRSPYSYDITNYRAFDIRVELDKTPRVTPGEKRTVTLTFTANPKLDETHKLRINVILPDGWTTDYYAKTAQVIYPQHIHQLYGIGSTSFVVNVGENIAPINRVYAEITSPKLPYPMMIPVTFIG